VKSINILWFQKKNRTKIFKGKYELKLAFPERLGVGGGGGRVQTKKPLLEGMDISETTQS